MADIKKISELNRSIQSIDTDLIPVVQGGENKATPLSQILDRIREIVSSTIGIVDNLESDSSTSALSAKQGKILNENKVDKESGKGLSENDFTDDLKLKLDGIESGAQVNPNLKTINHNSLIVTQGGEDNINISGDIEIVDNLETWDPSKALSAKQGVVLSNPATATELGRVMPDNLTVFVNDQGVLRTNPVEPPSYKVMIFKNIVTQPATPDISQNSSLADPNPDNWIVNPTDPFAGWENTITGSSINKWWMSLGTVNGNTNRVSVWTTPIAIVGEEGSDGGYQDFKFGIGSLINYPTPFSTNPDNTDAPQKHPEVWKEFIDGDSLNPGQYIWMTYAFIQNNLYNRWAIPVKIDGKDGVDGSYVLYQFAKNTSKITPPVTGWSFEAPELDSGEYLWMRYGTVIPPATLPTSWGTPVRISGENGQDGQQGKDGPIVYYMGAWNSTQSYTGTDTIRNIVSITVDDVTTYYITRADAGSFIGNPVSDVTKWDTFEANYKSIATEFLFAEGAHIGGWIFRKNTDDEDELISQNGATVLNGSTGEINVANGRFNVSSDGQLQLISDDWLTGMKIGNSNTRFTEDKTLISSLGFDIRGNYNTTSQSYQQAILFSNGFTLQYNNISNDQPITENGLFQVYSAGDETTINVILRGLPTTLPLSANMLWNDGGTLKIS